MVSTSQISMLLFLFHFDLKPTLSMIHSRPQLFLLTHFFLFHRLLNLPNMETPCLILLLTQRSLPSMLRYLRWNIRMTRLLSCWKCNWYKLPTKYKVNIAGLHCYQLCTTHVGIEEERLLLYHFPEHQFSFSLLCHPSFSLFYSFPPSPQNSARICFICGAIVSLQKSVWLDYSTIV